MKDVSNTIMILLIRCFPELPRPGFHALLWEQDDGAVYPKQAFLTC